MNNIRKALSASIEHMRPLTLAYLNQNFTKNEIVELKEDCKVRLEFIRIAIANNLEKEAGLSKFNAVLLERLLSTNYDAIRKASKTNDGISETRIPILNGESLVADLSVN